MQVTFALPVHSLSSGLLDVLLVAVMQPDTPVRVKKQVGYIDIS